MMEVDAHGNGGPRTTLAILTTCFKIWLYAKSMPAKHTTCVRLLEMTRHLLVL